MFVVGTPGHRRDGLRGRRERSRTKRSDGSWRTRHHRISALAVAIAAALTFFACEGRHAPKRGIVQPPATEIFATGESPTLQFIPRQQEVPGWRLEEDPKVIPGARLEAYLGPEAAEYARYGAVDVAAGNYATASGTGFAVVEIFRFPDVEKAFGAYSIHKKGPMRFLSVENEAFSSKTAIHLWRGQFYVRITGTGGGEGAAAMMRLLGSVTARMPAAPSRPAIFNFLPPNRVPNSERYIADSGFNQSFLGNSFQADFETDAGPVTGLVIPAASRDAAAQIIAAYRGLYVHNGRLLDPIPNLGEENFSAEDRYLGRAVAFRIDRFVVAFNGYTDRQRLVDLAIATDQRIIGSIRNQLVSADQQAGDVSTKQPAPTGTQQRP